MQRALSRCECATVHPDIVGIAGRWCCHKGMKIPDTKARGNAVVVVLVHIVACTKSYSPRGTRVELKNAGLREKQASI